MDSGPADDGDAPPAVARVSHNNSGNEDCGREPCRPVDVTKIRRVLLGTGVVTDGFAVGEFGCGLVKYDSREEGSS